MTATPQDLRDAGMRQAEDHADPRLLLMVDALIRQQIHHGRPFSANDIRDRMPEVGRGLVGARVRSFSQERPAVMVPCGRVPSTLRSTHGKEISLWRGVDPFKDPWADADVQRIAADLAATEQVAP